MAKEIAVNPWVRYIQGHFEVGLGVMVICTTYNSPEAWAIRDRLEEALRQLP